MGRKAFTEHPEFMRLSRIANDAVIAAAEHTGAISQLGSLELEARTDRVVDDLTRLLVAAHDMSARKDRRLTRIGRTEMTSFNRHGHAATAKAVELYDEQRDLEPFEHEFHAAVCAINWTHANMVGNAARQWGIGSIVYDAVVDLATRQQDADLTAALEAYQATVDAGDEVLELQFCEAAE